MIEVQTAIEIELPTEEVFAYVSDPRNFPSWNSAVEAIRPVRGAASPATYLMERNLPGGRATNQIEVVAREPDREFAFRTTSGPTPFAYRIRFTPRERATILDVDVTTSLGRADLAGPLARVFVKRGVEQNLATLKTLLERAPVSR